RSHSANSAHCWTVLPEDSNDRWLIFYQSEVGYGNPGRFFQTPRCCLFPPVSASADWRTCIPAYCGSRLFALKEEFLPFAKYPLFRFWTAHSPRFSVCREAVLHNPYSATCILRKPRNVCKMPRSDKARPALGPSHWLRPDSFSFFGFL